MDLLEAASACPLFRVRRDAFSSIDLLALVENQSWCLTICPF